MIRANMQEAKTQLSQLVAAAERGENVVLCRDGKPVVELRLVEPFNPLTVDSDDLIIKVSDDEARAPLDPEDWGQWAQ